MRPVPGPERASAATGLPHECLRLWCPGFRVFTFLLLAVTCLQGQELGMTVGCLRSSAPVETTYGWQIFYRHPILPRFGVSFAWSNEGHLSEHHRDGCSLQGWYCLAGWNRQFSLAAGLGPYRYYDTVPDADSPHRNHHGVGFQATLQGRYIPGGGPWSLIAQILAVRVPSEIGTTSLQLGGSYRFGKPSGAHGRGARTVSGPVPKNALGVFVGRTVLNSLRSENAEAWGLEFRRSLSPHWALAVAYANEGDPVLMRRDGLCLQGWLGGSPGGGRFYLGVGAGPHLARVSFRTQEEGMARSFNRLGVRMSMGAGWRFDPEWMGYIAWHRTYSAYDRDTDMFVTGLGFLW